MSYILKTYNGDTPIYFYKLCRKVYQDEETPAFREEIENAYVFDTKERAYRMMALIAGKYPEVHLELEEIEAPKLRGEDGYVPLEKTVKAMLSDKNSHRLWAEYEQLNTRRHLLKEVRAMVPDGCENTMTMLMDEQIRHMHFYMLDLLNRCNELGIDLDEVEKEIEP